MPKIVRCRCAMGEYRLTVGNFEIFALGHHIAMSKTIFKAYSAFRFKRVAEKRVSNTWYSRLRIHRRNDKGLPKYLILLETQ